MGAPKGSKNALGHDGRNAGRKSAYQERADAEELARMFYEEIKEEDIQKKLKGKRSLRDIWVIKGYKGDVAVLSKIFQKLFPDKTDFTSKGEKVSPFIMPGALMEKNDITPNPGNSGERPTPIQNSTGGETMG